MPSCFGFFFSGYFPRKKGAIFNIKVILGSCYGPQIDNLVVPQANSQEFNCKRPKLYWCPWKLNRMFQNMNWVVPDIKWPWYLVYPSVLLLLLFLNVFQPNIIIFLMENFSSGYSGPLFLPFVYLFCPGKAGPGR